jgi:hypothetical protein
MTEKRTKSVKIRLFESELSELHELKIGNELATWMREVCLNKKTKRRNSPIDIDPGLLRQLASIGNNLNQLARQANSESMSAMDSLLIIRHLNEIQLSLENLRSDYAS